MTMAPGGRCSNSDRMRISSVPRRPSVWSAFASSIERHDEARAQREAPRTGWDEEPRLGEDLGQPERLQEASLAPGVGPGHEHGRVVTVGPDVAGDHVDAEAEEERVEELVEHARSVRCDELRERHREPCRLREVVERESAEVKLQIPEQLHEAHDLVHEAVEHRVDEAGHDLAVAEVVAADEELDLGEPAAPG